MFRSSFIQKLIKIVFYIINNKCNFLFKYILSLLFVYFYETIYINNLIVSWNFQSS